MILSNRERLIIAATAVVGAAAVVYLFVVTPITDLRDAADKQVQTLQGEILRNENLLGRKAGVDENWKKMTGMSLKRDPTEAESQILHALDDWAREAGLKIVSVKPERASDREKSKKAIQEISFQAAGTGTMAAVKLFLFRVEKSKIPLRIKELQLSSRKEGADDLTLQLRLSTLYESVQPAVTPTGTTTAAVSTTGGAE